jgi:hypothetical protein
MKIRNLSDRHLTRSLIAANFSTQNFGPDRVGFGFLEILALIVAIGSHRKAEADDQCE